MKSYKILMFILMFIVFSSLSYGYSTCYQETANVSTACGGLNTGGYGWTDILKWAYDSVYKGYDEVWCDPSGAGGNCINWIGPDTSGLATIFYVNYTIPQGAFNLSHWQVGFINNTVYPSILYYENVTFPYSCFDQAKLQLKVSLLMITSPGYSNNSGYCYNGTSWLQLFFNEGVDTFSHRMLSEESIFWNITDLPNITWTTPDSDPSAQVYVNSITINATLNSVDDLTLYTINITDGDGNLVYNYSNSSLSGTEYNILKTLTLTSYGEHNVTIKACVYDNVCTIETEGFFVPEITTSYSERVSSGDSTTFYINVTNDGDYVLGLSLSLWYNYTEYPITGLGTFPKSTPLIQTQKTITAPNVS